MSCGRSSAKRVRFCIRVSICNSRNTAPHGFESANPVGAAADVKLRRVRKVHLAGRDLALILVVVALWGFSFVPIKWGLREVPPFALAALRFFFAAIPLVFFVRRPRIPTKLVIAYGLAIGVFQFGLLFLGMKLGMPAGLSSLVIQVQVFFTIGLGIVFLGDRLRRENVAGTVIATL